MKLNLSNLAVMVIFTVFSAFSQDHTNKIIEAYGQETFDHYQAQNPGLITLLNKYVDSGMQVVDSNPKYASAQVLNTIQIRSKSSETISIEDFLLAYSSGNFNPLTYGFFPTNELQIFVLGNSSKVLIIDSQSNLLK